MNWTGGRLQRHSKANANTQLKNQKQYFARARQRLQNGNALPSPSDFSILKTQLGSQGVLPVRALPSSTQLPEQKSRRTPSKELRVARGTRQSSAIVIGSSPPAQREPSPASIPLAKPHSWDRETSSPSRTHGVETALDNIKQRLLANSDWAGLAPTQPVRMTFASAQEMEGIGRRRKVTADERMKRNLGSRRHRPHHEIIRPIRHPESQSCKGPLREEEYSIRIGSNIHQTQTTRESLIARGRDSAPLSKSSESMLLDKVYSTVPDSIQRSIGAEVPSGQGLSAQLLVEHRVLVPLNEARDLNSWDEVLERSSSRSLVQGKAPSSTPFVDRGSSSMVPLRDSAQLRGSSNVQPHRSHATPKTGATDTLPDGTQDAARSPSGLTVAGVSADVKLSHTASYGARPSRFTLDDQVRIEQELPEKTVEVFSRLPGGPVSPKRAKLAATGPLWLRPHTKERRPKPSPVLFRASSASRTCELSGSRSNASFNVSSPADLVKEMGGERSSSRPPTWIGKFQLAKLQHQNEVTQKPSLLQPPHSQRSDRLADENDAWMKYVFPTDFDRVQHDFAFANPTQTRQRLPPVSTISAMSGTGKSHRGNNQDQDLTRDPHEKPSASGARTNANSTIFNPLWQASEAGCDSALPSETDFLSRYSPMAGVIDDALGHVSTYTNAARSERSVFPHQRPNSWNALRTSQLRPSLKRSARQAFSNTLPSSAQLQPLIQHRRPLGPIAQPHLWRAQTPYSVAEQDSNSPYQGDVIDPTTFDHISGDHAAALFPITYSPQSPVIQNDTSRHQYTPSNRSPLEGRLDSAAATPAMRSSLYNVDWHTDSPEEDWRTSNIHTASTQSRRPNELSTGNTSDPAKGQNYLHILPVVVQSDFSPPAACRSALQGFKMLDMAS